MIIAEKNILFLNMANMTNAKKAKILKMFDVDEDLQENFDKIEPTLKPLLTERELNILKRYEYNFNKVLDEYERAGIKIVSIYSEDYPELLKQIQEPPLCLYCKGDVSLLKCPSIAIVGSRKCSEYGQVTTASFTRELSQAGLVIVSGLALGVDAIAHKTALDNNGKTIAVLGGGFNHVYPQANYGLYQQICHFGLVVSEYEPNTEPSVHNFPIRNRIIAGLTKGTLITEAGAKSGALHTKNYAIENGREVFAIPGKITSIESVGTNNIIKLCQATLVTCPEEILNVLNINVVQNSKKSSHQLDIVAETILNYILAEKKSFQEIADFTKLPARELNNKLMEMVMNGIIVKVAGNSYISA